MSKYFLFFLIQLLIPVLLEAQEADFPKPGKFSQEEFSLTAYEADPEAAAVVLFDYGKAVYVKTNDGLKIQFTRHTRIKILKESGLDQANIELSYYLKNFSNSEEILNIKATSNNLVNYQIETQQVDKKSIFDEKLNDYWRQKRFSIPGVKVGSIIEITYTHITPFMFNITDWKFQREIPTIKSSFELSLVPFYEYIFVMQGRQTDMVHTSKIENSYHTFAGIKYQTVLNTFSMENVEAFYDDEYITSREDYIKKIDFQLSKINYPNGNTKEIMSNWGGMVKNLLDHPDFGKYIKSVEKTAAKQVTPNLSLDGKGGLEKIQTIRDFVSNSYKLNNFYGKYAMQKSKDLEKVKIGNIADINLYLIGLLRAAGFETEPVILSTRTHGKVYKDYPISDRFNYVIAFVKLENGGILVDASEPDLPYYLLPTRCLNGWGLSIKENPEWINVNSTYFSKKIQINNLQLEAESLITSVTEQFTHYDAQKERSKYNINKDEFQTSKIIQGEKNLDPLEVIVNNEDDTSFKIKYSKLSPIEQFANDIYILPFHNLEFGTHPLAQKKREYPVDFIYNKERIYQTTIFIPDSLTLKSFPKNENLSNDLLDFEYTVNPLSENTLQIKANYKLKKSIYDPKDYDLLKRNLTHIMKTLNKQVVLSSNEN